MVVKKYEELQGIQLDAIREMASIGAGNAATALSGLLDEKVMITVPQVKILDFDTASEVLGGPENIVSGVLVRMSGDIHGVMLYIQELDFINIVLSHVLGKTLNSYEEIGELERSALIEIGNIIISSYTTALCGMTGVSASLSVPGHCIGMAGGILNVPMAELGNTADRLMILDGNFLCGGKEAASKMLLVPDVESLNYLLKKLGIDSE